MKSAAVFSRLLLAVSVIFAVSLFIACDPNNEDKPGGSNNPGGGGGSGGNVVLGTNEAWMLELTGMTGYIFESNNDLMSVTTIDGGATYMKNKIGTWSTESGSLTMNITGAGGAPVPYSVSGNKLTIGVSGAGGLVYLKTTVTYDPNALTGTVKIEGDAYVGDTLKANISDLGGSGIVTFQWAHDGSIAIGTNSNTYVVTASDIGEIITLTVTRAGFNGSITSPPTSTVTRAYTLLTAAVPEHGGTVTPESRKRHSENTPIDIKAAPASGYAFVIWLISGNGVIDNIKNKETTVTLTGNTTINAVFTRIGEDGGTLSYEGQDYRTVIIDGKRWMAENLNYATGTSVCYNNLDSNCVTYGRMYNWHFAMAACPADWRLPTEDDWNSLIAAAGGSETGAKKLKAETGWRGNVPDANGTNDLGFSALPGGWRSNYFNSVGVESSWWGSFEGNGCARYISMTGSGFGDGNLAISKGCYQKDFAMSVRCVQEASGSGGHTHDWGEWTVATAATCEAPGVEIRICKIDANHNETRVIAQLTGSQCESGGHTHDWGEWTVVTAATCEGAGVEIRICKTDASHTETRVIAQLTGSQCESGGHTHDWGEWTVVTAATCDGPGVEIRICKTDAGHTETRAIAQLTGSQCGGTPKYCDYGFGNCEEIESDSDCDKDFGVITGTCGSVGTYCNFGQPDQYGVGGCFFRTYDVPPNGYTWTYSEPGYSEILTGRCSAGGDDGWARVVTMQQCITSNTTNPCIVDPLDPGAWGGTGTYCTQGSSRDERLVTAAGEAWVDTWPAGQRDGFIFLANGTYRWIEEKGTANSWSIYESGTWNTSGTTLTLLSPGESPLTGTYSVSASTFTWNIAGLGPIQHTKITGVTVPSPAASAPPESMAKSRAKRVGVKK